MWPLPSVFPGFLKTNTKNFYVQKNKQEQNYLILIWSIHQDLLPVPPPPQSPTLSSKPIHAILVLLLTSGPTPSALMSRASASHCDFCLPSFILDLAVTAAAETRRVMWWPWQGRRDEMSGRRVDAVYEVYLGDRTTYLEGCDNTAHNEGNTRQNCKMRRKRMFTRH